LFLDSARNSAWVKGKVETLSLTAGIMSHEAPSLLRSAFVLCTIVAAIVVFGIITWPIRMTGQMQSGQSTLVPITAETAGTQPPATHGTVPTQKPPVRGESLTPKLEPKQEPKNTLPTPPPVQPPDADAKLVRDTVYLAKQLDGLINSTIAAMRNAEYRGHASSIDFEDRSAIRTYHDHYERDAVTLRDRLIEKLPPGSRDDSVDYQMHGHAVELMNIRDDLKRLANLLQQEDAAGSFRGNN
jgi:hypothetical protein